MIESRQKPTLVRALVIGEDGRAYEKTMRMDAIKAPTQPFHDQLPEQIVQRAASVYWTLGRIVMQGMSLEKWIDGFRYNQEPEGDVFAWEKMSAVFDKLGGRQLNPKAQYALACAINAVSLGVVDVESQTGLSTKAVERIRQAFDDPENPDFIQYRDHLDEKRWRQMLKGAVPILDVMNAISGEWSKRDEPVVNLIREADIIFGVYTDRKSATLFCGKEALSRCVETSTSEKLGTLCISLKHSGVNNHIEILAAAVMAIRGSCCYGDGALD